MLATKNGGVVGGTYLLSYKTVFWSSTETFLTFSLFENQNFLKTFVEIIF